MIRVLQVVGVMHRAGLETFLMDMYKNINRDVVQFDFVVHGATVGEYEEQITQMGGKVYHITRKKEGLLRHYRDLYDVVKKNHYDIVIRSTESSKSVFDLMAVKAAGAKHAIVHSHNGLVTGTKSKIFNYMFRGLLNVVATERFACSTEAGEWLFGKQMPYTIINNGRDLEEFSFSKEIRNRTRKELGFSDENLVINVGRFQHQKNHRRILEIFAKLRETDSKSRLLLVSTGPLLDEIKKYAEEIGVAPWVQFLGVRTDISALMQVADAFLMPSFYEGLPLTVIEAQATGLPCILSDTISPEVEVSDCVSFISLDSDNAVWADKLQAVMAEKEKRTGKTKECREAGYDMKQVAKEMEDYFVRINSEVK